MLTYAAPKAARGGMYRRPLGQSFQTTIEECSPRVRQLQRPGGKGEVTGIKELTMQEEGRGEESNWTDHLQSLQGRQYSWGQHMPPGGMGNRCAEWRAASQESLR